jgi:hypothetical protein
LLLLPDPQKAIQPLIELYFDVFVVSAHRAITPISVDFVKTKPQAFYGKARTNH